MKLNTRFYSIQSMSWRTAQGCMSQVPLKHMDMTPQQIRHNDAAAVVYWQNVSLLLDVAVERSVFNKSLRIGAFWSIVGFQRRALAPQFI